MYSLLFIVGSSELFLFELLRDSKRDIPVFLFPCKINGLQPQILPGLPRKTSGPNVI